MRQSNEANFPVKSTHRIIKHLLIAASCVGLLSGCAAALVGGGAAGGYYYSEHKQGIDAYASDSWITSKVKSKLVAEKGINSLNISVTTTKGVVYLTGTTKTVQQREQVIALATHTEGVKRVDASNLVVGQ